MNGILTIDLPRTYKKSQISKFEKTRQETEEITKEILVERKIQDFAAKGFIRLATGKRVKVEMPPKFPGKPLSEYLREIRE